MRSDSIDNQDNKNDKHNEVENIGKIDTIGDSYPVLGLMVLQLWMKALT